MAKALTKFNRHFNLQRRTFPGFTLVEIMIVMVIVGILATIGVGSFQASQVKSRDASRKSDLRQIVSSLEVYYNDHGQYPTDTSGLINGCSGGNPCSWGDPFVDANGSTYMVKLPDDPTSGADYHYSSLDGSSFQIYARLENNLDRDINLDGSGQPAEFQGVACGSSYVCNYGLSSTNTTPEEGRTLVAI